MEDRAIRKLVIGLLLASLGSGALFASLSAFVIFEAEAAGPASVHRPRLPLHSNLLLETAYGKQTLHLKLGGLASPTLVRQKRSETTAVHSNESEAATRESPNVAGTVVVAGRVIDGSGNRLRGLTVRATTSTGGVLTTTTSSFGVYRFENVSTPESLIIRPVSKRFRFAPRIITVTADEPNIDFISEGEPLSVNAGSDQIIALPNTVPLNGSLVGGIAPQTALWSKVSGPGDVVFANPAAAVTTATISTLGTYLLRLTVTDAVSLTASDDVMVAINPTEPPPPPDPVTIAPPINPTVATNPFDATRFLYTGANAIQTGVTANTIKEERVASLRGRVVTKAGEPIPNVRITVLNNPELGQTMTRADGMFDLVVNGGGVRDVKYEKAGFIPVQREETSDWQEYKAMDDVVMIPYDGIVSPINLASSTPIQVAQSGIITDASGTRRSRLFFKQGTTATMRLPNGSTQPLTTLNVRATEFTTGANGPETMPGELPANSAYTYAVEYSVDEAIVAGATETTFSQPVVQYNENFLDFPVGIDIPSGAYDRETGQWVPSTSGRVVKILSSAGGIASLDVNGNGQPATDGEYAALGVNIPERQQLAALYPVNQGLWRVPLIHFSPWDSNWPYGPPPDAEPPNDDPPPACDT